MARNLYSQLPVYALVLGLLGRAVEATTGNDLDDYAYFTKAFKVKVEPSITFPQSTGVEVDNEAEVVPWKPLLATEVDGLPRKKMCWGKFKQTHFLYPDQSNCFEIAAQASKICTKAEFQGDSLKRLIFAVEKEQKCPDGFTDDVSDNGFHKVDDKEVFFGEHHALIVAPYFGNCKDCPKCTVQFLSIGSNYDKVKMRDSLGIDEKDLNDYFPDEGLEYFGKTDSQELQQYLPFYKSAAAVGTEYYSKYFTRLSMRGINMIVLNEMVRKIHDQIALDVCPPHITSKTSTIEGQSTLDDGDRDIRHFYGMIPNDRVTAMTTSSMTLPPANSPVKWELDSHTYVGKNEEAFTYQASSGPTSKANNVEVMGENDFKAANGRVFKKYIEFTKNALNGCYRPDQWEDAMWGKVVTAALRHWIDVSTHQENLVAERATNEYLRTQTYTASLASVVLYSDLFAPDADCSTTILNVCRKNFSSTVTEETIDYTKTTVLDVVKIKQSSS
eukprot:GHVU01138656.1.p1 GENE.GHVU01138656.1~~GHVU01138656.1.p1  ORF type:complete len:500 (-),score=53.89 GHVU01138656.1:3277-4776(-)